MSKVDFIILLQRTAMELYAGSVDVQGAQYTADFINKVADKLGIDCDMDVCHVLKTEERLLV